MIEKVAGFMSEMKIMPEDQIKEITKGFIPKLKRWQNKQGNN
jgi:hypothetical protein